MDVDIDADRSKSIVRADKEKMTSKVMRRSTKRERVSRVTRVMMLVACVSVSMFVELVKLVVSLAQLAWQKQSEVPVI